MITTSHLSKLVPEAVDLLNQRIQLLNEIAKNDIIGRRQIALNLNKSERLIRTELENLKRLELVSFTKKGVKITPTGQEQLQLFSHVVTQAIQLEDWSKQFVQKYGFKGCVVVPGDCDSDAIVFQRMAQQISQWLDHVLPEGKVILSVTGGTTVSNIVQALPASMTRNRQFSIVPARGGGRGEFSIQANTVSHLLAKRLNGENHALFVPEQISKDSLQLLMSDPNISKTLQLLKQSDCLIYSVGNATIMAERRAALKEEMHLIQQSGAVGEALGVFFDKNGRIVHRLDRLGLGLDDLTSLPCEVLVAGGSSKKDALKAYLKLAPKNTYLVIDEALANLVLKEETL